ncbi:uncharacterized protein [Dermacentor albipictus]|uniref:uncharacterized protein n=1 Tax=Dermacentor albipictus TaxID=60249 RepID=UPI0038FD3A66
MESQGPLTPVRPHSTANTYDVGGDIEIGRWLLATVIAVIILVLITGLAFLIDGMWRRSDGDRDRPKPPSLVPGKHLLSAVACNSTLCRRYSELISSCVGHGQASPCEGLSRFVCGEGACYSRPIEGLVRGFLRALAADALASWRLQPAHSSWPPVDRAAALYETCRQITAGRDSDLDFAASVRDSLNTGELRPFLATNETAAEMATRLAAHYQDGALLWLDAAAPQRGESKRRLVIRANRHFVQRAEYRDSSSHRHRKRRSPLRAPNHPLAQQDVTATDDVAESVLSGMHQVHALWKKAGNLLAYNPELVTVGDLDRYGLISAVLISELNLEGSGAPFTSNDSIEVTNGSLLPFLSKVLQLKNIKAYLAWEFVRHRWACAASPRIQEKTLADSCFDCVERVAGLAAHIPFLRVSGHVESQAKASFFLTQLKNFVVTAVGEVKWLPPRQRELMLDRLYRFQFMRGAPARKDSVAQINELYAYLPQGTGSFERDFDAAAHAAWNASLRRAAQPLLPLLSAFPNVLSANDTAYIPAVALVPPLFSYDNVKYANYAFLGVALMRALAHSIGLTGLLQLPEPRDGRTAEHLRELGRCLRLSHSSTQAYASQLADVFAMGAIVRAFVEGRREKHSGDAAVHEVFADGCLYTCTSANPHRCDVPVVHTAQFEQAFSCLRPSHMMTAPNCTVW